MNGLVQVKGAEAVLTEDETEAVVAAVAPFQQAYLGTCLTRMSDAATAAFPGGNRSLPTSAELQKFIGCAAIPRDILLVISPSQASARCLYHATYVNLTCYLKDPKSPRRFSCSW